ncbi:uncharacterized protein LOC132200659 [Neocloeon triangulifer]|uniref:uncharacterized protein LOC132200659 n=1 Tax=Neocloeon triangulifer TaxID=2078957 RepID=UPI00286EF80E|nr:uncharacterized protein LOC132200659 [Neocloeon triangulifer]
MESFGSQKGRLREINMSAANGLKNLNDSMEISKIKVQEQSGHQKDRESISFIQISSTPSQNLQPNESNALCSFDAMINQEFVILDHPPDKEIQEPGEGDKTQLAVATEEENEKMADKHNKVGLEEPVADKSGHDEISEQGEVVAAAKPKVRKAKNATWKEGEPERLEENMAVEAQVPQEKKKRRTDGPLVKRIKKNLTRLSVSQGKPLLLGTFKYSTRLDKTCTKTFTRANLLPNQIVNIFGVSCDPEEDTADTYTTVNQAISLEDFVEVCQEDKQDGSATMSKEPFGSDCSALESDDDISVVELPKEKKKTRQRQGKKPSKLQQLKANMSKANPLLQKKRNK